MTKKRDKRPIVLLAQTPPPFHGQAVMTQVLKESLEDSFDVHHVRMDFSRTSAETKALSLIKLFKLLRILACTVWVLIRNPGAVLYYPPAPGHWIPILRDFILLSICRPLAAKTVFHFHARGLGDFLEKRRSWFRFPWMRPDYAIVLGQSVRHDAEVIQAKQIVEIPYGFDVDALQPTQVENNGSRILFAGFHTASKGIFDLLETARCLQERSVGFKILTAGEWDSDDVRERFYDLVRRYSLDDCIEVLGQQDRSELHAEYASADIFFFPTYYEHETFGVVVAEAMAHGLPVVSSKWPGPIDVVSHKETGFLCEVHDIEKYADALEALVENPGLRERMGESGRRRYLKKYTHAAYAETIEQTFSDVCDCERY